MLRASLSRKILIFSIIMCLKPVKDFFSTEATDIVEEYISARQLYVYKAYKDLQIFHFNIPVFTIKSVFNLTSNNTDGCTPRNITVYLQAKSYPVVSPDGSAFPDLAWVSRQPLYEATFLSDLTSTFLTVVGPQPGDWFMAAFIFDDSNRITQAGIVPSCSAWLHIKASYYQEKNVQGLNPHIVSSEAPAKFLHFKINQATFFGFFIPSEAWSAEIAIKNCNVLNETTELEFCPLKILLRPLALPFTTSSDSVEKSCMNDEFENCNLSFTPMPDKWHYCSITPINNQLVSFDIGIALYACHNGEESFEQNIALNGFRIKESLNFTNATYPSYNLSNVIEEESENQILREKTGILLPSPGVQETKESFTNDFAFQSDSQNSFIFQNVLTGKSINRNWNINSKNETDFTDSLKTPMCWPNYQLMKKTLPGNFEYKYNLLQNVSGSAPTFLNLSNQVPTILTFKVHSLTDIGGTLTIDLALSSSANTSDHNVTVLGCLSIGMRSYLEEIDDQVVCDHGFTFRINTTDPIHFTQSVVIPYPEPGIWFFTLFPSCYLTNQSFITCLTNTTSVIFNIASSSCIMGKCGDYGSCFQYISGGFIFSTCVCDVGYRGYACSDGTDAIPNWKLLVSTLLLCLSNLFFLPAIFLALYRQFYTEALVYAFTMFFSTFYHACDQEIYSVCIMRLSVLQFCDFYSAILSFWVTLIIMANLPNRLISILHMFGAMVVALGTEYNRTGISVFAIPSITAFIIMVLAWVFHTKKRKRCYPPRIYWIRSLLPGTALATTGLICFAFLETEDNYFIIHSFWHSIMAISILCLLPPPTKSRDCAVEEMEIQVNV